MPPFVGICRLSLSSSLTCQKCGDVHVTALSEPMSHRDVFDFKSPVARPPKRRQNEGNKLPPAMQSMEQLQAVSRATIWKEEANKYRIQDNKDGEEVFYTVEQTDSCFTNYFGIIVGALIS